MQQLLQKNPFYEILLVAILVIVAFSIRYQGFKNGGRYTFDEALYVSMARDMVMYDISCYNGIHYSNDYLKQRPYRTLPDYLFRKLFKHPPMYCFMLMFSYNIHNGFGARDLDLIHQAVKVSISTGVLTIIALYLIGRLLFSPLVGLLAALFLAIDPVHWITSQKIWMDTTITFYMTLSGLFYLYALRKKEGDWLFYILTGLAIGAAALTKYPGGMVFLSILLFTAIFQRDLLKMPKWIIIPACMILMLMPWFFWNLDVYGFDHFLGKGKGFEDIRAGFKVMGKLLPLLILLAAAIVGGIILWKRSLKDRWQTHKHTVPAIVQKKFFWLGLLLIAIVLIARNDFGYILRALSFKFEPETSWKMGFFADEPWYFYFKRLFIYFPIYIFAYISVVFYPYKQKGQHLIPIFYFGIIALFFVFWGNFQCRYFLPAVPWLLLFAAFMVVYIHDSISSMSNKNKRICAYVLLWGIVTLCIAKAIQVDVLLAWTNKPCYF